MPTQVMCFRNNIPTVVTVLEKLVAMATSLEESEKAVQIIYE